MFFGFPSPTLRSLPAGLRAGAWIPVITGWVLLAGVPAFAESTGFTVQWGGFFSADQTTLSMGPTVDRFTDPDNLSRNEVRYDPTLNGSLGLNLISFKWSKQWDCSFCQGIRTNVSAGVGLMPDNPGRFQADMRNFFRVVPPQAGRLDAEADRVSDPFPKLAALYRKAENKVMFGSNFVKGGSDATLSKDLFGRSAVHRLAIPLDVDLPDQFSLMGRVTTREQFWSLSYRQEHFKIEGWTLQNSRDTGPNYGIAVAYNVEWYSTSLLDLTSVWKLTY